MAGGEDDWFVIMVCNEFVMENIIIIGKPQEIIDK